MTVVDERNKTIYQEFSGVNLELDCHKTNRIRLVLQNVSDYECPLTKWGVIIQYLAENDDATTNIPLRWWDYYTLARFEIEEHAAAFANSLTKEETLDFLDFILGGEKSK